MKQKMKQWLGALLSIALILGLMPGMSLTAYADDQKAYAAYDVTTDANKTKDGDALTALQVTFNEKSWYIIADNSTAVNAGTVTLLAAESLGTSKFHDFSNKYSTSTIKTTLDNMTASGGSFAGVASAINTVKVKGSDSDDEVDAKLYLLNTTEASNVPVNVRTLSDGWWLLSPGFDVDLAAFVDGGSGVVNGLGYTVIREFGVRPALKLNLSSVIFSSESKTFSLKPHYTHSFTYSASGATITAMCGAAGCDLTDSKATLTIVKPTLETYLQTGAGISPAATLTGLEAFKTATGLTVTADSIKYFKATKSGSTYTKDGTALAAAPTYAGDYIAEITLTGVKSGAETTGDVAASVGYTIAKPEITITTAPAAGEITYGQTLEDSTLTGGAVSEKNDSRVSVEGTFAWKDLTVVPTVSDSQKTEYDVVFTPKNTNYATAECKVKLTVNKADSVVTKAPTVKTLTYTGSPQALVSAGTSEGGEMQYALGAEIEATQPYTTSIPTATDAGTYYVWYMVKGDEHHTDSKAACVKVTIGKKEISRTVTFKVVNGFWDDGTSNDKTETLKGYEGDELKLSKDQIPAVGNKPGSGYAAGSWDKTPSTKTAITKDITYTYTYAKASAKAAKVSKAPTAKKLTYNGKDQNLVNAGKASNGKMYYAVTKNTTAPKASAYKTSIPTGKTAGTYYVWYKVKGDKGYKDSAVKKVKVTIAKAVEEPFNFNTSFKVTQKDGQVTVTWNKVNGLSKVDAYVAYCGTNYPEKKIATTTKNTLTIKKIAGKKIDLTKDFKLTLVGYGTDKKTKKSVSLHIAGKDNKKFTNVKSFTLSKASVSVKKGKSTKVLVETYKLEDTGKKELSDGHAAKFRYRSTNSKIAKVDKNGRITGVKEGKCKVFVYTRNGLSRKIAVTVTK